MNLCPSQHLSFQVIHCKLAGSEQVAEDDIKALQMFCQLALGKNLLAEVTCRSVDLFLKAKKKSPVSGHRARRRRSARRQNEDFF